MINIPRSLPKPSFSWVAWEPFSDHLGHVLSSPDVDCLAPHGIVGLPALWSGAVRADSHLAILDEEGPSLDVRSHLKIQPLQVYHGQLTSGGLLVKLLPRLPCPQESWVP